MNDLDEIKNLMDPPPGLTDATVQAARSRLTAAAQGTARPRVRSRRRRTGGLLATASVLAAAAAVAIPSLRDGDAPAPAAPEPSGNILVAAAERIGSAPQGTGRFWTTHLQIGTTRVVGKPGRSYVIEANNDVRQWTGKPSYQGDRFSGWHPWRPVDRQTWRRDGAPGTWSETVGGLQGTLSSRASGGGVQKLQEELTFMLSGRKVTADQLRTLPTEPAALRDHLRRNRGPAKEGAISDAGWLFADAETLLLEAPAPPKVRSAAYRMLVGLPGLREIGPVTDALGRPGSAVALREPERPGTERWLVVDRATGRLLSTQEVATRSGRIGRQGVRTAGDVLTYRAALAARWTNDPPKTSTP
ncbi:CU044_5270 family protein [Actinomadura roseirufa]|uniref:CU044_5270 family protein n=1 Tax=Actinomadura roseirufa TaxID=2094049 RepID=UPI001040E1D6|nr:CU044_5270 family protein [Actinomadura roseirufa]